MVEYPKCRVHKQTEQKFSEHQYRKNSKQQAKPIKRERETCVILTNLLITIAETMDDATPNSYKW